jgi:hypothetical protein
MAFACCAILVISFFVSNNKRITPLYNKNLIDKINWFYTNTPTPQEGESSLDSRLSSISSYEVDIFGNLNAHAQPCMPNVTSIGNASVAKFADVDLKCSTMDRISALGYFISSESLKEENLSNSSHFDFPLNKTNKTTKISSQIAKKTTNPSVVKQLNLKQKIANYGNVSV